MSYFTFTGESKVVDNVVVHQIVATEYVRGHGGIQKGTIGGYVQSADNLTDNAWVADDAVIMGDAHATDGALISGRVVVKDYSYISGGVKITDLAVVEDYARIIGAQGELVPESILVCDDATISGHARLSTTYGGSISICNSAIVEKHATLTGGGIRMRDHAIATDNSALSSVVTLSGESYIGGDVVLNSIHGVEVSGDTTLMGCQYIREKTSLHTADPF